MELVFLGTGTSHGIPVIGCDCEVCCSSDLRDKRLRSSLLISNNCSNIIIDSSIDFRAQALSVGLKSLDSILFTHTHADHLFGLDDIRPLSRVKPVEIYADNHSISQIYSKFDYIFDSGVQKGGGLPQISLTEIEYFKPFIASGVEFLPLPIFHGRLQITAYRFGNVAYLTDCSYIPEETKEFLRGLDILIIDALKYTPHPTHFSVDQALEVIRELSPRKAYFTHMCHVLSHRKLLEQLPAGVEPSYDGLKIKI
ncbi:MAG: MBL fold metallo-hydrolase [Spirochaetales bacterium]|nr:MBL fold metallo-hydrolase [Spirochaetales bacterium]